MKEFPKIKFSNSPKATSAFRVLTLLTIEVISGTSFNNVSIKGDSLFISSYAVTIFTIN